MEYCRESQSLFCFGSKANLQPLAYPCYPLLFPDRLLVSLTPPLPKPAPSIPSIPPVNLLSDGEPSVGLIRPSIGAVRKSQLQLPGNDDGFTYKASVAFAQSADHPVASAESRSLATLFLAIIALKYHITASTPSAAAELFSSWHHPALNLSSLSRLSRLLYRGNIPVRAIRRRF